MNVAQRYTYKYVKFNQCRLVLRIHSSNHLVYHTTTRSTQQQYNTQTRVNEPHVNSYLPYPFNLYYSQTNNNTTAPIHIVNTPVQAPATSNSNTESSNIKTVSIELYGCIASIVGIYLSLLYYEQAINYLYPSVDPSQRVLKFDLQPLPLVTTNDTQFMFAIDKLSNNIIDKTFLDAHASLKLQLTSSIILTLLLTPRIARLHHSFHKSYHTVSNLMSGILLVSAVVSHNILLPNGWKSNGLNEDYTDKYMSINGIIQWCDITTVLRNMSLLSCIIPLSNIRLFILRSYAYSMISLATYLKFDAVSSFVEQQLQRYLLSIRSSYGLVLLQKFASCIERETRRFLTLVNTDYQFIQSIVAQLQPIKAATKPIDDSITPSNKSSIQNYSLQRFLGIRIDEYTDTVNVLKPLGNIRAESILNAIVSVPQVNAQMCSILGDSSDIIIDLQQMKSNNQISVASFNSYSAHNSWLFVPNKQIEQIHTNPSLQLLHQSIDPTNKSQHIFGQLNYQRQSGGTDMYCCFPIRTLDRSITALMNVYATVEPVDTSTNEQQNAAYIARVAAHDKRRGIGSGVNELKPADAIYYNTELNLLKSNPHITPFSDLLIVRKKWCKRSFNQSPTYGIEYRLVGNKNIHNKITIQRVAISKMRTANITDLIKKGVHCI